MTEGLRYFRGGMDCPGMRHGNIVNGLGSVIMFRRTGASGEHVHHLTNNEIERLYIWLRDTTDGGYQVVPGEMSL
jgi:hypothetical protein